MFTICIICIAQCLQFKHSGGSAMQSYSVYLCMYVYTMCPPSYHHNGIVAAHELKHSSECFLCVMHSRVNQREKLKNYPNTCIVGQEYSIIKKSNKRTRLRSSYIKHVHKWTWLSSYILYFLIFNLIIKSTLLSILPSSPRVLFPVSLESPMVHCSLWHMRS